MPPFSTSNGGSGPREFLSKCLSVTWPRNTLEPCREEPAERNKGAVSGPKEEGWDGARVGLWIQPSEQGNSPAGETAPCRTNIQGDEPSASCEEKFIISGVLVQKKKNLCMFAYKEPAK